MSKMNPYQDRVIALSALMQTVTLVQQIADSGQVNNDDFSTMLSSLLAINATNTAEVYGGIENLRSGLLQFNQQLAKKKSAKDVVLLRYAIALLHLERKLTKRPAMLDLISREIEQIPQQVDYFGSISSPQVIARFACIYERTVSELTPRVQVYGDASFLQQPDNVNKVRALLLAGIRAAVLWRQKGGNRWQFIFASNKLLTAGSELLNHPGFIGG
ncbi:MAG: high frequency lysogenization protein HflD [Methylophaga sp.]|nr:high frequency lysogenization protein HflD [Methylophaga sp.]